MGFEKLAELRDQLVVRRTAEERTTTAPRRPARQGQRRPNGPRDGADAQAPQNGQPATPGERPSRPPRGDRERRPEGRDGREARERRPERPARAPAPDVDPVVLAISRLQRHFPAAFPKRPLEKLPLKLGIHQDLVGQSTKIGMDAASILEAVKTWCEGSRYWACLTEGAARVDLTGQPAGTVTAAEAKRAQQLAGRQRQKAIAARRKAARDTKPEDAAADATATPAGETADAAPAADADAGNTPVAAATNDATTPATSAADSTDTGAADAKAPEADASESKPAADA